MQEPIKLMIARFPYGAQEHPDVCDWVTTTVIQAREDPRIKEIRRWRVDDTPITMGRNQAIKMAMRLGCDMILMIDADMSPDGYLVENPYRITSVAEAMPFWSTSFDFLWKQRRDGRPSVIGAPYCGPPPHENIYVFHWETKASDIPDDEGNHTLEQYTRFQAATMRGITEVAALPTGLILMDMEAVAKLQPPYTYYEWTDEKEDGKASTEDVTFTRDLTMLGVPLYCNWDAWAGHWKRKCVGRPHILSSQQIGEKYRQSVLRDLNIGNGEKLVDVGKGSWLSEQDTRGLADLNAKKKAYVANQDVGRTRAL
jgi:hypothetical protein